jgi:hypothetical protein
LIDETDVEMFAIFIEIYAALDATDFQYQEIQYRAR